MKKRKPYTYVTASIDEEGTRFSIAFHTPDLSVAAMGAESGRPFLNISSAEAAVVITVPGCEEVTEQDVTLAREIVNAATRYLADCERLHAEQFAVSADENAA
ncbi:hypothetical protein [Planomonospora sp. ID82291]|uniref:hypothetical protein n=1 Tax=Planomonospora sp. ID82291 TaxID=2738136 RepID=UPI0018C43551|nr:hypothetical protein [Planomonospora sp. ID82291]MBG0814655.1 hypothetical protein [Planomonospora sp. ID82291]